MKKLKGVQGGTKTQKASSSRSRLAARAVVAKTEAGKTLTPKEQESAARVLVEMQKTNAADDVLPSDHRALERPNVREAIVQSLVELGVDMPYLAKKIKSGMEATVTKHFQHEGVVTDSREEIAWGPRHAFLTTALDLITGKAPAEGGSKAPTNQFVYVSHLGDKPKTIDVTPPKDGMARNRLAAQRPMNRKSA